MCFSCILCFCGRLIKGDFEESSETKTQVDLHFYCIVTMDKVDTASTALDAATERLFDTLQKDFNSAMDDFGKSKDVLKEARDQIHEGFEDLRKELDALATKNGVPNVDESEVLNINAGG